MSKAATANIETMNQIESFQKAGVSANTDLSTLKSDLKSKIESLLAPHGFELVLMELEFHHQKTLRLFIDRTLIGDESMSIEDCVKATHALSEPLEATKEVEALFHGNYELEVSSPGVDRPLLKPEHYVRFTNRDVILRLTRPLTAEEAQNDEYTQKHPKQKDFVGTLKNFQEGSVYLAVKPDDGTLAMKNKKKGQSSKKNAELPVIHIPFELISKCNLHPEFDFSE